MTCWLCLTGAARAGDYSVKYAVDLKGEQEVGQAEECIFRQSCHIELGKLGVTLTILMDSLDDQRASVGLTRGANPNGCCFFFDGISKKFVRANLSPHHLPLYEGRRRRGNELVLNQEVGTLSLIVSNAKDRVPSMSEQMLGRQGSGAR
jgi:hypothetical protein